MAKDFNIAIMGCGVVGGGVADILLMQEEKLSKRFDRKVKLTKIVDLRDFEGTPYAKFATKNADDVINDASIDLVVVTIGGLEFAADMCRKSLLAGKHVVTSNKAVVAANGRELTKIAFEKNVRFLYEASCGGGIPIIRPLNICLSSNDILEIAGILNGTTNYMLTRMENAGLSFEEALKEAQANGYAEQDPTADVDGYDAARKIAILSSIAYDKWINFDNIKCEGIRCITTQDMDFASANRAKIKLIARSRQLPCGSVEISVAPMMISNENMLSGVSSVYNSILTKGSFTDYTMFYGQGAGKSATASAVCGDIIEVLGGNNVPTLPAFVDTDAVIAPDNETTKRYLRISGLGMNIVPLIEEWVSFSKFYGEEGVLQMITTPLDQEQVDALMTGILKKFGGKVDLCIKAFAF